MISTDPKDLFVLTADKDAQFAVEELLRRGEALQIRHITFDCVVHADHDGGVRKRAHEFLRTFLKWRHALVIFDHEGCGRQGVTAKSVEQEVEQLLRINGWEERSAAIAIDPELEAWVWDESLWANRVLHWPGGTVRLRAWMEEQLFICSGEVKPKRPKESFLAAQRYLRRKRSSAIFTDLARNAEFSGCTDPGARRREEHTRESAH